MPLLFPDEYKPDTSTTSVVQLRCHDADTKAVVNVMVWDTCIEAHAIAVGWKEPSGDYDRNKILADVLDNIVADAGATYDRLGKPKVFEMKG